MKITYDTATDSISASELTEEQNRQLQGELVAAMNRNEPVRTVAATILSVAR